MKQIDESQLPKYGPELEETKRLYAYLQKVWEKTPCVMVPRDALFEKGILAGLTKNQMWNAVKELERVVDCVSFWDSENKTMVYAVIPLTPEEKIKIIEDAVWFESLP